nr:MFS transporter [Marinicella sp. W31]MDC2879204.1 MFS transporter [Marinicella sp. W31]
MARPRHVRSKLFTGKLIARFGKERIAATGLVLIAGCAVIALSGLGLTHFWAALILLGVGWNFGFIGATAMITDCHTAEERGKVQGLNDFLVFGTVASASFLAGALVNIENGWSLMNWLVFPAVLVVLVPLVFSRALGLSHR